MGPAGQMRCAYSCCLGGQATCPLPRPSQVHMDGMAFHMKTTLTIDDRVMA